LADAYGCARVPQTRISWARRTSSTGTQRPTIPILLTVGYAHMQTVAPNDVLRFTVYAAVDIVCVHWWGSRSVGACWVLSKRNDPAALSYPRWLCDSVELRTRRGGPGRARDCRLPKGVPERGGPDTRSWANSTLKGPLRPSPSCRSRAARYGSSELTLVVDRLYCPYCPYRP